MIFGASVFSSLESMSSYQAVSSSSMAMARPPWTPFECCPGLLHTSTSAGFDVATRATRSITFAGIEVIFSARCGVAE